MKIHLEYFARLRSEAGVPRESLDTSSRNPRELLEELKARHGFKLDGIPVRCAVNDDFASLDQALAEGDKVVFILPVSGG